MIEKIIRDYLTEHLDAPVYTEQPKEKPIAYVVIERTGGSRENMIRSATLAIQSYNKTMLTAAQLHERVIELMNDSITLDAISSVDINSEYNFTDTATKQYRYQAVFDIVYY